MNVSIICFSQSGNTRKIADTISNSLQESGHRVKIISLENANAADAVKCEVLGIGTPCFCSRIPTPMKKYLHSLPRLDHKAAFVFSSAAGASGKVLYDMKRLLCRNGAHVIGGINVRGQDNFPVSSINGRFISRPDYEDLAKVQCFAKELSEHISLHGRGNLKKGDDRALKRGYGYFDLMGMIVTDSLFRFITPKLKLDRNKCSKCAWCENVCPMKNITMNPYPLIGPECIRCYFCYRGCPESAFSADFRFANLLISIAYNPTFLRWFGDIDPGEKIR